MEEETPPPQMPYLFAVLASRVCGRLARPPPRPPSWGATIALPGFNPYVLRRYFTWQMAASLLRTKPRELYSDTRELAHEEAHAERLPAAGDKKVAGWRLRHQKR